MQMKGHLLYFPRLYQLVEIKDPPVDYEYFPVSMSGAGQFRVQKITGFHVYHEMTPLIIMRRATRIDQTARMFLSQKR